MVRVKVMVMVKVKSRVKGRFMVYRMVVGKGMVMCIVKFK